ncbi:MAG TPA: hypothetical protein VET85_04690 [Stellaceae bacterium]|nr:hypothetical protein [Stellaceae bacterium]
MSLVATADDTLHRPLLSLPLAAAALAFLLPLLVAGTVLLDPDTYLHVAAGRWMIDHGALPVHDPFSHSMPGATWIPHEWLAELLLAGAYNLFGWGGVVVLALSCFAAGIGLLMRRLLADFEPFSAVILTVLSTASMMQHLLARAHILAMPCLVGWCAALFSARDARRAPSLALLPVMTVWANLHGSFMFGIALAVYLGAEAVYEAAPRDRRPTALSWGRFVLLAVVAASITPNGLDGLLMPFRFMNMPVLQASFNEWLSPNFQHLPPLEFWLLGAMLLGFSLNLRLPITRVILLLGLFHLALKHARHTDLVALVVPFVIAASWGRQITTLIRSYPTSSLTRQITDLARPASGMGTALVAAILLVGVAVTVGHSFERKNEDFTPDAALAEARRLGLHGPVLNSEGFGGYLIFSGIPTFIDGRMEMYGDPFLKRFNEVQAGLDPAFSETLEKYHITWTMLEPKTGAVGVLDHLPGWHRVYADDYAVIHARDTDSANE